MAFRYLGGRLPLPVPPASHVLPSPFPPPLPTGSLLGPNLPDRKSPEVLVTNSDSCPRSKSISRAGFLSLSTTFGDGYLLWRDCPAHHRSSPTPLAPTH